VTNPQRPRGQGNGKGNHKAIKRLRSRSRYWWCDENDRHHHLLFGKLHP